MGVYRFESCVYSFIRGCVTVIADTRHTSTVHSSSHGMVSEGDARDDTLSPLPSQTGQQVFDLGGGASALHAAHACAALDLQIARPSRSLACMLPSLLESPDRGVTAAFLEPRGGSGGGAREGGERGLGKDSDGSMRDDDSCSVHGAGGERSGLGAVTAVKIACKGCHTQYSASAPLLAPCLVPCVRTVGTQLYAACYRPALYSF